MNSASTLDLGRIAQDLQIRKVQVEAVVSLLDEGNTVPFIARYRTERTGGLPEEALRAIEARARQQRQLSERKQTLIKNLQLLGKLTDELHQDLLAADSMRRLDDLYLPFKPKRKSIAQTPRERGLEPVAHALWHKDPSLANFDELLPTFVNPEKGLATIDEVKLGVQQLLAELMADLPWVREAARRVLWETGKLVVTRSEKLGEGQGLEYKDYHQFNEPIRHVPPHRILAINRGEKENALRVQLQFHADGLLAAVAQQAPPADHPHLELLKSCILLGIEQVLVPSLEREIRRDLTELAEEHALHVFARNLKRLLLQPPIRRKRVLAIDPGFRGGCRLAVLDEQGQLLEHDVVHPHPQQTRRDERRRGKEEKNPADAPPPEPPESPSATATPEVVSVESALSVPAETPLSAPQPAAPVEAPAAQGEKANEASAAPPTQVHRHREEAKARLAELVRKHDVHVFAIGSGTACRETEELIAELIAGPLPELSYVIVNEAGASHYSASVIGREEFPDLDTAVRATISIGRRLQDPLSELVKIDPQNIGVGLYQHDINEKRLRETLENVFQYCVNHVGADLNSAGVSLLRHVAGLNPLTARNIVEHRKTNGPFRSRAQLASVAGISPSSCTQAAGFLKVAGGEQPLDAVWVHPESYALAESLLARVGTSAAALADPAQHAELPTKFGELNLEQIAQEQKTTAGAVRDLLYALCDAGCDPRDELPQPIFKRAPLRFEDLQPGMELRGTVLNVVDFGAFVDVGLKDSGLVHISQLANRFVKSPHDIVSVGDVVTVWVLTLDNVRTRVALTMIQPGTERKPAEKRSSSPPQRRPQPQGERRGRRPQPAVAAAPASQQTAPRSDGSQPRAGEAPRPRRPQRSQRPPPQPQRTYHPPRRERPPPELTEEALQGEQPLRTFAELKALYEAKKKQ